ncbi:zinc finger and BTB domain-containing protein ttk isoform X2 [Rhodnius prolixus]|uniref:zinc finger and BTB domain-containing protein ttk isoform X2 n=1 Tax=Rhodnius prolixus TaxID=13249 RepID=UPI003D18A63A
MGSQRFCLRWNNHQSNLLSVFDQLLHDEAFVDVTLAVEGQFLRAHKMVLSACSPYFQALFVGHPDKHPIVILKDVPYSDMRSLLDFMYRGEVSVDQDRLTAFLKVAESLRIKGLTEVHEERCDLPEIANSLLNPALPPPPPPNLHRLTQIPPQVIKRHHLPPTPMLNSALTGPKRKRGRPRKLSGSNPGTPNPHINDDQDDIRTNNIGNHLDTEGGQTGQCSPNAHCSPSLTPDPAHCVDNTGSSHTLNESDRSTSQSPLDTKTEPKDELMHDESHFDGENETDEYSLKIEEEPKPSTSGQDVLPSYQSAVQTDGERYSSSGSKCTNEQRTCDTDDESQQSDLIYYEDMIACSPASSDIEENDGNQPYTYNQFVNKTNLTVETENMDEDISQYEQDSFQSIINQQQKSQHQPQSQQQATFTSTIAMQSASSAPIVTANRNRIDKMSIRKYCTREGNHMYRCNVCSKTYTHISNFCRHFLAAHYGIKQDIHCPVCLKPFTRKDNMMTHAKQVHGMSFLKGNNNNETTYDANIDYS